MFEEGEIWMVFHLCAACLACGKTSAAPTTCTWRCFPEMGLQRTRLLGCLLISAAFTTLALLNIAEISQDDQFLRPRPVSLPQGDESGLGYNIWITMGLCWSNNTHYWGKDKFPYKESAPLAARLWMHLTPAKVVLQVVYSEPEPTPELLHYQRELEAYGAVVKLVPKAPGLKCVLEAQLIRIVAYLLPEVRMLLNFTKIKGIFWCLFFPENRKSIFCNYLLLYHRIENKR